MTKEMHGVKQATKLQIMQGQQIALNACSKKLACKHESAKHLSDTDCPLLANSQVSLLIAGVPQTVVNDLTRA